MAYTRLLVKLGNSEGQSLEIPYRIRSTDAAEIWADCLKKSQIKGFAEQDRFYGFPGQERNNLAALVNKLDGQIQEIRRRHPELDVPSLDRDQIQASINRLHYEFAHGHIVTEITHNLNDPIWRDFNTCLHALEVVLEDQVFQREFGLNFSFIVFTWNELRRVPIPEKSFQDFSLGYHFGTAYINYCQVGRHIKEMFDAKDDALDDSHIMPFQKISGDTLLWFGATFGNIWAVNRMNKIKTWFHEREERFGRLGFKWGDPKLALGYIPVAQMEESLYTGAEIKAFQERLSSFNRVISADVF